VLIAVVGRSSCRAVIVRCNSVAVSGFPLRLGRVSLLNREVKWYGKLIMRQRSNAILEFLAASSEPTTYQQIAQETGLKSPKTALSKLKAKGLINNTGKNQWTVTSKGQELLRKQLEQPVKQSEKPIIMEEALSEEDTFREAGKTLYFSKQGDRLDSIVYYVKRISGFSNPVSIWNALTDFNLAPRVKYTWIKMYLAIASPWKKMPAELEETLKELI